MNRIKFWLDKLRWMSIFAHNDLWWAVQAEWDLTQEEWEGMRCCKPKGAQECLAHLKKAMKEDSARSSAVERRLDKAVVGGSTPSARTKRKDMPVYEYKCVRGHKFEAAQPINDPPLKRCPKCKSYCKRLIPKTTFHLKGPGWAKDGYSPSGKKDKT